MILRSKRMLAAGAAVVVSAATCWAAFPVGAATTVPEVAPYFETSGPHKTNLSTAVASHGLKSFTASFVLGKGCTPTWDDSAPISTAAAENALVTQAKSEGATPIISFGGQAGDDVAGEVLSLANAQTVVSFAKTNGVHRLAFWALGRDQACGSGDSAPYSCTGVSPSAFAYTAAFLP